MLRLYTLIWRKPAVWLKGFHLFWEGLPDAGKRLMGACQYLIRIRTG